jgi:hypothetical protein
LKIRLVFACALVSSALQGQAPRATITDLGPGPSGRILQEALARPHRLIEPDTGDTWFILARSAQEYTSLIVLGRSAAIAGLVEGDVIVVGGDLHVRPGARISGRAIAIGGGVYPSSLAFIGKGSESYRDNTFAIARTAQGYRLEYRSLREHPSPPLLFPGIYGLRFPSYDRVNGASVPFGPSFSFAGGRGALNALATYRSDLGKFDPSVAGGIELTRRSRLAFSAQRGTFTNDAWIWGNFVNSLSALVVGTDTRNYYRADRAELTLHRLWEFTRTQLEPFLGGRMEKAWSVGPQLGDQTGPWSIFGRTDSLGMRRPNPPIDSGTVTSVLGGGAIQWESQQLQLRARSRGEMSLSTPSDQSFNQITSDLEITFPTFGEQEYALEVHWVTSPGEAPPPAQRFVYIGGSGTLPFLDLLEQGGDELLLIDQRYSVPLLNVRFGIFGIPTLLLRHRIGSAGFGDLPSFEQMIGVGVMLTILRGEIQIDPASGKVRTSVGFSFSR